MYDKSLEDVFKNLIKKVFKLSGQPTPLLLQSHDAEGNLARRLVSDLKSDFKAGKLFLNYQPQINYDNTIFGTEALIRWQHEQLGAIPPPVLIALAEEAGMIDKIGLWVFKTAAEGYNELKKAGFGGVMMSVNVSPLQLDNSLLADEFKKISDNLKVPPERLEIEITEQAAINGVNHTKVINDLRKHGFCVAMDDFVMGDSSLKCLNELNLSTIKLDGELVKEILTNPTCAETVSSVIRLSRSMNLHVIAEYVETAEQRELLNKLGCYCYQGWLYSPAVSLEKVIETLKFMQ
jgi:EAL domain-containing protein (putative c-di-GMP-specific phosphodiesterase class I)